LWWLLLQNAIFPVEPGNSSRRARKVHDDRGWARSDWMAIERERGISVSAAVNET
jgi:peptide subunit release factor RF-3